MIAGAARSGWGGGIDRVVAAIEALALADGPVRLSDLAQTLSVPKSAAHRVLAGLVDRGWVERDQGETYALTLRMALLGQRLVTKLGTDDLRQPILDRLAATTRELVRLTGIRQRELVWIGSARGRHQGLVYEPDMTERVIPFATANGKAWLSTLPNPEAIRIAREAGLGRTDGLPKAVKTAPALVRELEATRERGYGLALEEAEPGVAAIAVTVERDDGLLGTMSVAAPVVRLGPERIAEIMPSLRRAAQSMAMAWRGLDPDPDPESSRGAAP